MKNTYYDGVLKFWMVSTFCFFLTVAAFAQKAGVQNEYYGARASEIVSEARFVLEGKTGQYPAAVKFKEGSEMPLNEFASWLKQSFKMPASVNFEQLTSVADELGFTHYKYAQTVNNIPVDRAIYTVKVQNGLVKSFLGDAFIVESIQTTPVLSEEQALQNALVFFKSTNYLWESEYWEQEIKEHQNNPNATYYPKGTLTITNFAADQSTNEGAFRLAYVFDVYASDKEERIFVDAQTGRVLYTLPLASNCSAATVNTIFNGSRAINTDKYTANDWRLRDDCQAAHVRVRDWNSATDVSNNPLEIDNTTNTWTTMNERFGGTVLWEAKQSYWYFKNVHQRSSYDGGDGDIECYINAVFKASNGTFNTNNASMTFSGSTMKVGLGSSGTLANSWSTLDIIGHEFAHAVTGTSTGLVYQGESGALNESFSDIFGDMIENWVVGPNDWLMGDDRTDGAIRSMSDPRSFNDPDTYLDDNWASTCGTCSDNGGVHTNSGVQNYWFYLVAIGDAGTNENGDAYNVTGIGRTKASAIAFENATVKLGPNSNYAAARVGAIEAAEDLYGACSNEVKQVTNAWYAVGVGNPYVDVDLVSKTDVSCAGANDGAINISPVGTSPFTYSWSDGPVTQDRSGLSGGNYTVTITDATGCTASLLVTIIDPAPLSISIQNESDYNGYNVTCFGMCDGIAQSKATGGTPPYSYVWNDANNHTTASADDLCAGDYTVTVTDANGCTANTVVNISEPPMLTASIPSVSNYNGYNISCNGGSDGWATAVGGGGVMPYSYEWSDGQTTATATNLSAGYYEVTITDANNCTETSDVILTEPTPLTIDAGPNQTVYYGYAPAECANISWSGEGGGVAPYTITWSDGGAQMHQVCPGINTTTYTVTILDANGCTETDQVAICVIDVRCGNKLDKVELCHVPEEDPLNTQTLCVSYNAVATHLAHGDMLAACGTDHSCPDGGAKTSPVLTNNTTSLMLLDVYPNPIANNATVEFSTNLNGNVTVEIYDNIGRLLKTVYHGQAVEGVKFAFEIKSAELAPGLNLCILRHENGSTVFKKIIRQ
jgi:Zn-dependent metalloprotease